MLNSVEKKKKKFRFWYNRVKTELDFHNVLDYAISEEKHNLWLDHISSESLFTLQIKGINKYKLVNYYLDNNKINLYI